MRAEYRRPEPHGEASNPVLHELAKLLAQIAAEELLEQAGDHTIKPAGHDET